MTKSEYSEVLGVTRRTLYSWVKMLVDAQPGLFDFERYKRSRLIPPYILAVLDREFGLTPSAMPERTWPQAPSSYGY